MANLFAGRFDEALSWAEKAFMDSPSFLMVVAVIVASHALAGRRPALRVSSVRAWLDIRSPENLATFEDGLRRAGLPE